MTEWNETTTVSKKKKVPLDFFPTPNHHVIFFQRQQNAPDLSASIQNDMSWPPELHRKTTSGRSLHAQVTHVFLRNGEIKPQESEREKNQTKPTKDLPFSEDFRNT
jgi:hypothetical protein